MCFFRQDSSQHVANSLEHLSTVIWTMATTWGHCFCWHPRRFLSWLIVTGIFRNVKCLRFNVREQPQRLELILEGPIFSGFFWLLRNFFKTPWKWLLRLDIQDDQDRAKIALMGYKALVKVKNWDKSIIYPPVLQNSRTRPWTNVEVPLPIAGLVVGTNLGKRDESW